MNKKIIFLLFFVLSTMAPLYSHPHCFIDAKATLNMQGTKLNTILIEWVFDQMTSTDCIETFDANNDGKIDATENNIIKNEYFPMLTEFNYYTSIKIEGKNGVAIKPVDFKAQIINKTRLKYSFEIPVNKVLQRSVVISFSDPTIFVAFEYSEKEIIVKNQTALQHSIKVVSTDYGQNVVVSLQNG